MAEVTYYGNSLYSSRWSNPNNMIDNNLETFASESVDEDYARINGTTCLGTDLGIITKVEVRPYGYGDGNDKIDFSFSSLQEVEYEVTMPASAGWGTWCNVTDDPKIGGWTWAKIATPVWYVSYDKVGAGNPMYCAKVEIRVTYTPSADYYHGLKVQGVGELALCDVGNHPLRIRKGGVTYGIELVETNDPNASAVRIKTPSGVKAIRKYT